MNGEALGHQGLLVREIERLQGGEVGGHVVVVGVGPEEPRRHRAQHHQRLHARAHGQAAIPRPATVLEHHRCPLLRVAPLLDGSACGLHGGFASLRRFGRKSVQLLLRERHHIPLLMPLSSCLNSLRPHDFVCRRIMRR